jgi:hypothetical protein
MPRTKNENAVKASAPRGRKAQQTKTEETQQSQAQIHIHVQVEAQPQQEVQSQQPQVQQAQSQQQEERPPRSSRTMWVNPQSKDVDTRIFNSLKQHGLETVTDINKGYFLTWDTMENAVAGFASLTAAGYSPRYKFYRVYFTMNGLAGDEDYSTLKTGFIEYLGTIPHVSVQFCKFYRKDGKFSGGGDLSVDTQDGYNNMLSSKSQYKTYKFGNYSGTFYKFNSKKSTGTRQQSARQN